MMYDWSGSYGGMGWGMGLGMLLFWGLVLVGVVALARWLGADADRGTPPPPNHNALDILAQRYARGEIDREEYEQKRRDLERL